MAINLITLIGIIFGILALMRNPFKRLGDKAKRYNLALKTLYLCWSITLLAFIFLPDTLFYQVKEFNGEHIWYFICFIIWFLLLYLFCMSFSWMRWKYKKAIEDTHFIEHSEKHLKKARVKKTMFEFIRWFVFNILLLLFMIVGMYITFSVVGPYLETKHKAKNPNYNMGIIKGSIWIYFRTNILLSLTMLFMCAIYGYKKENYSKKEKCKKFENKNNTIQPLMKRMKRNKLSKKFNVEERRYEIMESEWKEQIKSSFVEADDDPLLMNVTEFAFMKGDMKHSWLDKAMNIKYETNLFLESLNTYYEPSRQDELITLNEIREEVIARKPKKIDIVFFNMLNKKIKKYIEIFLRNVELYRKSFEYTDIRIENHQKNLHRHSLLIMYFVSVKLIEQSIFRESANNFIFKYFKKMIEEDDDNIVLNGWLVKYDITVEELFFREFYKVHHRVKEMLNRLKYNDKSIPELRKKIEIPKIFILNSLRKKEGLSEGLLKWFNFWMSSEEEDF